MALVFISHSSKDKAQTEHVSRFISDNGIKSVFLDYDEKNGIKIGEEWEQRLYAEIKRSHVVLVLLSPAWIASDWCKLEYSQAKMLGKEILPIIIEHGEEGEVEQWIGNNIQQKDFTKDESILTMIVDRVKEVAVETQQGFEWDVNRSPYPGMTPFEKEDAAVFFGKTEETIEIIEKLTSMNTRNSPKLLNMVAASGMGKSSLLRAGVLPKIELSYGDKWVVLPVFKPTYRPLYAFAILITTFLGKKQDSYKVLFETLMSNNYKDVLDDIITDIGFLSGANKSVLFCVDQAEEFYTVARKEEKKHFFKVLTYLLEKKENFFTLWTLRSDFINLYQLDNDTRPLHAFSELLSLEPMGKENIAAIIKNPAKIAAIEVDDVLVEKIKEDIETTDALPLLALCLDKLYQKHADSKKFTLSDYNDLTQDKNSNPLENIVKETADSAIARWRDDEKKMELLKKAFIPHLVRVGDKSDYVKRVAPWEEMPSEAHEMLEALVKARLLIKKNMSTKGDGVVTLEVAHETLLRTWPLLKKWLKEEDEFLIGKSQLEVSFAQWSDPKLSKSEKKKALLSGLQLDKALGWKDKLVDEKEIGYIEESNKIQKRFRRRMNIVAVLAIIMSVMVAFITSKQKEQAFLSEKIIKQERDKANHNIGLALVEKALNSKQNNKMVEAHYYALKSLKMLDKGLVDKNKKFLATYILNKNKNEVATLWGHGFYVDNVSFSPDGKILASGSWDKTIKLWDVKTQKEITTLRGHTSNVSSVSFSADGKTLTSISWDKTIKLWDVKTKKNLLTFSGSYTLGLKIFISPNRKILASTSEDNTIKLWDIKTKKVIATLKGHTKYVHSVSFLLDGKILASTSEDNTIKLWDIETKKEIATLEGHIGTVLNVALSPNKEILASCSEDNTIKLWNMKTKKEIATLRGHTNSVWSVSFSPNGKTLASASDDQTIRIWDVKTQKEVGILGGHTEAVRSVSFSPNGKTLASASFDNTIKLWDVKTEKWVITLKGHMNNVDSISLSPDGKTLISSDWNGAVKLWNMKIRKEITMLKGNVIHRSNVSFSPDGKIIAFVSRGHTIKLWDIKMQKEIATLKGHTKLIKDISFSKNGKMLASASYDQTIRLWNMRTKKEIAILRGHTNNVNGVSISPNGKILASVSDDMTVKLWDVKTKKEIITLRGHKWKVSSVMFSPDGKMLASGSWDATIKLWDVESKKEIITLRGHKNNIESLAFSPNGEILASASFDNTIKLWDMKTKKKMATLYGHTFFVSSVIFSPDGKTLVSSSRDYTIKLWDIGTPKIPHAYERYLEYQLQSKLEGISLVPQRLSYIKAIWPKHHPFHWEDKAEAGDAEAMYQLGIIYDRDGENAKALEWYHKALKAGHKDAQERIVFLEKWMKEHQE